MSIHALLSTEGVSSRKVLVLPPKDPADALRNKRFGDRLKALLKERGLKQADLARSLGIAPSSVNRWTRGEVFPKLSTRVEIARFLGVTVAYLDYGEDA